MRPEAFAFPASALTVWVGPMRYVFAPGRDVIVGYGPGCDIPLEQLGNAGPPPRAPRPDVVLRFVGTHWVAIEWSPPGFRSNGFRCAVDIHDAEVVHAAQKAVRDAGSPARARCELVRNQLRRSPHSTTQGSSTLSRRGSASLRRRW